MMCRFHRWCWKGSNSSKYSNRKHRLQACPCAVEVHIYSECKISSTVSQQRSFNMHFILKLQELTRGKYWVVKENVPSHSFDSLTLGDEFTTYRPINILKIYLKSICVLLLALLIWCYWWECFVVLGGHRLCHRAQVWPLWYIICAPASGQSRTSWEQFKCSGSTTNRATQRQI